MSPLAQFAAAFGLTLALLVGAVVSGRAGRRRLHVPLVIAMLLALVGTIVAALRLGHHYDLQSAGWITPTHLLLAKIATAAFLPTAILGWLTLRNPRKRKLHGRLAWLAVTLTVAAAITGTIMLWRARAL